MVQCVYKCTQQQKWQKDEHIGESSKYGKNDNFATITNSAKHKATREPIKVGDTSKFGENDNFRDSIYESVRTEIQQYDRIQLSH